MDYDVLIMARDNTHSLSPEKEDGRWKKGMAIDVFPFGKLDPLTQPEAFQVVHVMNFPGPIEDLKAFLLEPDWITDRDAKAVHARTRFTVETSRQDLQFRADIASKKSAVVQWANLKLTDAKVGR